MLGFYNCHDVTTEDLLKHEVLSYCYGEEDMKTYSLRRSSDFNNDIFDVISS